MRLFFSIIIATYNSEAFLERTLKSIIDQNFENFELIIIDGLSNDKTMSIVDKYIEHISIVVSEKDNGIYDAWNKGVNLSQGEWIMFVGSDDLLSTNALKNYWEYINNSTLSLDYVSSRVELIDKNQRVIRTIGKPWNWDQFKKYMCVAHVGSIHHHSIYKKHGMYNISYKITGDYELLLRPKETLNAGFFDVVTAQMQLGGVSLSSKVFKETFRAKVETAKRNTISSKIEMWKAIIIFNIRSVLNK